MFFVDVLVGDTANKLNPRSPQALVKEYIEHEGLRMIDFFKLMDKDKSGSISRDEFVVGLTVSLFSMSTSSKVVTSLTRMSYAFCVNYFTEHDVVMCLIMLPWTKAQPINVVLFQNANIILSQHQLDKMMKALDKNGDGEIDFS